MLMQIECGIQGLSLIYSCILKISDVSKCTTYLWHSISVFIRIILMNTILDSFDIIYWIQTISTVFSLNLNHWA